MKVLVLLALCLTAVSAMPKMPQRIIGGSETTIYSYPTMTALMYSRNLSTFAQWCGGTILNQRSVLTAAHCVFGDSVARWRFRVGSSFASSGGVVHSVSAILLNPNYNFWTFEGDVAILRSTSTIVYGTGVAPASIAGANYNLADNEVVWAAGWGIASPTSGRSEQLRHVQVWTVNQDICASRYGAYGHAVTADMLCSGWLDVGGRDQCDGDSGGPLYHNNVVVGVCSWGFGCAQAYFPGVNARVSSFTNWIVANA